MRRFFSRDVAQELGGFVNDKILKIQKDYTRRDGGTSESRAALAQLRRDLDGGAPMWMTIGADLFEGWSQTLPSSEEDPAALLAAKTALELYAVHQQSKRSGVAQNSNKAHANRVTFGRACWRIVNADPKRANGVTRRLTSAEAAPDFDGMVRNVRALIMLMRAAKGETITLDYRSLAQDLYQIQFPEARSEVFQRWSMDYYSNPSAKQQRS